MKKKKNKCPASRTGAGKENRKRAGEKKGRKEKGRCL